MRSCCCPSPAILQQLSISVSADEVHPAGTSFETLLSLTINKKSSRTQLYAIATFSADASLNAPVNAQFRLTIDGTVVAGSTMLLSSATEPQAGAVSFQTTTALTAGAHTVLLEWSQDDPAGGLEIAASSNPSGEHATLTVTEID